MGAAWYFYSLFFFISNICIRMIVFPRLLSHDPSYINFFLKFSIDWRQSILSIAANGTAYCCYRSQSIWKTWSEFYVNCWIMMRSKSNKSCRTIQSLLANYFIFQLDTRIASILMWIFIVFQKPTIMSDPRNYQSYFSNPTQLFHQLGTNFITLLGLFIWFQLCSFVRFKPQSWFFAHWILMDCLCFLAHQFSFTLPMYCVSACVPLSPSVLCLHWHTAMSVTWSLLCPHKYVCHFSTAMPIAR